MYIPFQRNVNEDVWYLSDVSGFSDFNLVVQTAQGHSLVSNTTQATQFESRAEALAIAATLTKGN